MNEQPPLSPPPLPIVRNPLRRVLLPPIQRIKRVVIRYNPGSRAIVSRILKRAANDPLINIVQGSDEKYQYVGLEGRPEDIREVLGTEASELATANEETMRQSRRSTYPNSSENNPIHPPTRRFHRVENSLLKKTLKRSFQRALQTNSSRRSKNILPKRLDF